MDKAGAAGHYVELLPLPLLHLVHSLSRCAV